MVVVAKLVAVLDCDSSVRKDVRVQVPSITRKQAFMCYAYRSAPYRIRVTVTRPGLSDLLVNR